MDVSTYYWTVIQTVVVAAQTVMLALTLKVLRRYTDETARLRAESQKHTELQLRPFVVATPVLCGTERKLTAFEVRNIGTSAALRILVNSAIRIPFLPAEGSHTIGIVPPESPPGTPDQPERKPGAKALSVDPAAARGHTPVSLRIEFYNVAGEKYFVEQRIILDEIEIVRSGPR